MYNARQKLEDNIQALKVVLTWDGMSALTEENIQILKRYSGFGGLKAILYKEEDWVAASEADKKLKPLYDELYDLLESNLTAKEYKKVIESLRNSTLSAFYTPKIVPDTIYRVLSRYMKIESLYEPSAGAGVYIESAIENLPDLVSIRAYEKDILTGKILSAIVYSLNDKVLFKKVHIEGFEESGGSEEYDLIISNIPFGNYPVYDESIKDPNIYKKIHNYFFAKGIEKIKEGGVLCYLTTDAFLNSPSNKSARRYLLERCDLLSVIVMPDNLYKESAGTEAPSHLVVVRKNTGKMVLTGNEELLCESSYQEYMGIKVPINHWVMQTDYSPYIGVPEPGKNQYGKPALEVRWLSPIEEIECSLESALIRDLDQRWIEKGTYIPTGRVEIISPGKFKWKKEEDDWGDGKKADAVKMPGGKFHPDRPITLSDIPDKVKMFLPKHQQQVIVGSEEHWDILNNLQNIIEQIPGPYGQEDEGITLDERMIYLHYFYGGCDWYITERDEWGIQYQMFGYANLGDDEMAEWGYIGVPELEDSRVELDLFWKPCRFGDIGKELPQVSIVEEYTKPEVRVPIPDTCTVEPVKGTIIQVEGKLLQIEQINSDGTVTVVDSEIKAGRDQQVMEQYLQIRDALNELEINEKE